MQNIVVPANVEAERSLLGAILLDYTILNKVEGRLYDRDFYEPRNKVIFNSMLDLFRDG